MAKYYTGKHQSIQSAPNITQHNTGALAVRETLASVTLEHSLCAKKKYTGNYQLRSLFVSQNKNCTLVISSHVLAELEQSCDYVVRMDAGRCVRAGAMDQVTERRGMVRVQIQGELQDAAQLLTAFAPKVQGDELILRCPVGVGPEELNAQILPILLAAGVKLLQIRTGQSLEAALLK